MTLITLTLFAMTFALAVTCYILGADNERRRQQVAWLAGELRDAREAHDERDARCRELEGRYEDVSRRLLEAEGYIVAGRYIPN